MISREMRLRLSLATLVPLVLVMFGTAAAFWRWRVSDLEEANQRRVQLLAHQVAIFCANGLFSGNLASLQKVLEQTQREPGLRAVYVFGSSGELIAHSGGSAAARLTQLQSLAYAQEQRQHGIEVIRERIQSTVLPIEDMFASGEAATPLVLGDAVLEFNRGTIERRERESLQTALLIALAGMALGGLLAVRLSQAVVQPIMRIYQRIERIGRGDFSRSQTLAPDAMLRGLEDSLNDMAQRLAWGRDELERQVQDVTRELREKMLQAQEATQAKSKFLASASHDLRQPAHALGMFVARLGQLPMDPPMRLLAMQMEASVQSMQDLLDSLLDLSRLDSGTVSVRMEPVDLDALLRSVRQAVEAPAQAKGLRLHVRATRLWGFSDAGLLQRIVVNLALNAVRYTPYGSVLIACRSRQGGTVARIEVWDTGIGIAEEHHEDIFKEFYQLRSHQGDRRFGMGLGLNIVQRSAALLGHLVELRSVPGRGSCFSVTLRTTPALPAAQTVQDGLLQQVQDFGGARVLVIEDNPNAQAALCGLLSSWGCDAVGADSLESALQQLARVGAPDVVLSDFQLGSGANGIEAIARIRARYGAQLAACLVSGETQDGLQVQARAAGLTVLHKPVRPAKLRSLLRRLLPPDAELDARGVH